MARLAGPQAPLRERRRTAVLVARCLHGALLASILSGLIVVADHLLDTWSNGSLVLALLVLWLVLFAGLLLFARSTKRFSWGVVSTFQAWSERVVREDAWAEPMGLARSDDRVLADVNAALMFDEQASGATQMVAPMYSRR